MKAPKFATRVQTSVSGREMRVSDQPYPIWTWTLVYNFLRDGDSTYGGSALGSGYEELRTLMGFFLRQQGSFQAFLYNDPTDYVVAGQQIAFGDGITTNFQLIRTFGGFSEPITQPTSTAIFVNGVSVAFSTLAYGVVQLAAAPAAGALVTANFTYDFPVRFSDDTQEYENFMYQLWSLKQLKFQSVILP